MPMNAQAKEEQAGMPPSLRIGVLALLWGSTFLWISLALDGGLPPAHTTLIRSALGAALLLVLCRIRGLRLPRGTKVWGQVAVAAFFCNALPYALFAIGQRTVDSGVAGVLNATTPLWAVLIGLALGSERGLRPVRAAGLLLGFAGVVLIFAPWRGAGLGGTSGVLAIAGAGASYAVAFAYMGRRLAGRGIPTLSLAAAQLLVATALSVPAVLLGDAPLLVRVDARGVVAVVVLGVLSTGVSFCLTYRTIADEGATNAAAVGYLLPVVSVALGVAVRGEPLTARVVLGMAVVLAGVALTRRKGPAPTTTRVPAGDARS